MSRKLSSEQQLKQLGIKADKSLLCLPDVSECQFRSVSDIVHRLQSLMLLTAHAEELPSAVIDALYLRTGAQHSFTLNEQHWLAKTHLTPAEKQICMWRYESIKLLLWAIGHLAELGKVTEGANIIELSRLIQWQNYDELLAGARPLNPVALLDTADLYHRMSHLGRHQPRALPANINLLIVNERYACLSWLIGESEWDE
nr:DUF4272 domain-containing protein [Motilimonas cestriensis]